MNRRQAMAAAPLVSVGMTSFAQTAKATSGLRQSICRWCYGRMPLEQLCEIAKRIGYDSIELLNPPDVEVVRQHGLKCAVLNGGPSIKITSCLNRPENHDRNVKDLTEAIEFAAANDVPQVICFSGNRAGMPDDVGMNHCVTSLKRIVGLAEAKKVTLIMELLNSKVDHKDYMCDHTEWGADLVKAVGSPRFKLLYDIYHMQIMEGDVIRTIKKHHDAIAHYHTGGVPGRNEIDASQELNYGAICRAIRDTRFNGFIGQEFMPKRDPAKSLEEAFRICA
jgi:hydroxypyruvate isomerase